MHRIADRKDELRLFERILRGEDPRRILLLSGPSERGKSVLLAAFATLADQIYGKNRCARGNLKGGLTLNDLFATLAGDLDSGVVGNYQAIAGGGLPNIQVETNLTGARIGNQNTITVQPSFPQDSAHWLRMAAEAIITDLRGCAKPIVIIIDSFEAAIEDVSQWITQRLLVISRHNPKITIVLAGQELPKPSDFLVTWGGVAGHKDLHPVTSIDDWHEFACSKHPQFPRHYIEGFCKGGLVDRPSIIQELIENIIRQLPRLPG